MVPMLQAISTTATVPVVRVPWLEPGIIMKTLDAGAYGVICPMVNTREDAQKLVAYTHYAPRGTRSFGPVRALLYSGADYPQHANDTIVTFAMIETAQALDNLEEILSTPGLDAIYIGPSDLSLALGCNPTFDDLDPKAAAAVEHILARAKAHGLVAGIHNGSPEAALKRIAMGFQFVTVSSDAKLIAEYGERHQDELRPWQPEPRAIRRLKALMRRLADLQEIQQMESNRLEVAELSNAGSYTAQSALVAARGHFRNNDFGKSASLYKRLVELEPQSAEGYIGLGASYDRLRRFDLSDRVYASLYAITGMSAVARRDARQQVIAPMVHDLHDWMRAERARMSKHNPVAKAINYMFEEEGRWEAFTRFLDDGRICLTNNAAERALRGVEGQLRLGRVGQGGEARDQADGEGQVAPRPGIVLRCLSRSAQLFDGGGAVRRYRSSVLSPGSLIHIEPDRACRQQQCRPQQNPARLGRSARCLLCV